jgi:hypothetical protein
MTTIAPMPLAGAATRRPSGAAGLAPGGRAGRRPAPSRTPLAQVDDAPARLAAAFAALYCEVAGGRRPAAQLARLVTPHLYARLVAVTGCPGRPLAVVVRCHGSLVGRAAYEAVCVVRRGPRFGALAFRLCRVRDGWLVDDIACPDDGPLPPPAYAVPCEPDDPDEL